MPDADLALLIDRLMRRIHVELQAKAPEFDTQGVGPAGGMFLLTLAEHDGAPLSELTRLVARDKSQMTRMVAGLERKGLITRAACKADARVTRVSLTAPGRDTVAVLQAALTEAVDTALDPLDAQDRHAMRAILSKLP